MGESGEIWLEVADPRIHGCTPYTAEVFDEITQLGFASGAANFHQTIETTTGSGIKRFTEIVASRLDRAFRLCLPRVGITPDPPLPSTREGHAGFGRAKRLLDEPADDWRSVLAAEFEPSFDGQPERENQRSTSHA